MFIMKPAEELQQKMGLMRQKNDQFFEHHLPEIFKIIKGKHLSQSEIRIFPAQDDSTELEIDVIEKGKLRYYGKGIAYSEAEADKFIQQFASGQTIQSLAPPSADSFTFDRVGSNQFKKLVTDMQAHINYSNRYPIEEAIPLLVFTGVGLGFHIERILQKCKVGNLIIFEHSLDRFLTSLYTIDWENIYQQFTNNEHGTIQLILSYGSLDNNHKAAIWNELVQYCPHFPFSTIFYNHLMDTKNQDIIQKIQTDVPVYTNQWGHFDDEINQYNNARHNLLNNSKLFTPSQFAANNHIPVIIIGGGPSLDDRIEIIRKYRDKALIISCGTSIGTLYRYGLKPHIHVELESDLITYEALSKSTDEEFRKNILLIGAAQLNPLALNLFPQRCIFFKDSSALGKLFLRNRNDVVSNVTPTCTNAGVALAIKLGFNNIFLAGLDFGFIDKDKHHAQGSIYYKNDVSKLIEKSNDFAETDVIETTSVHGQKMWTKPMYFTAKRRVEETIRYYFQKGKKVYNCSNGANINNAPWTSNERMEMLLEKTQANASPEDLVKGIQEFCSIIDSRIIDQKSNELIAVIEEVFDILGNNHPQTDSIFDISNYIFDCNNKITRTLRQRVGATMFFIRGHSWIILMFYFTYTQLAKSKEDRRFIVNYMNKWIDETRKLLLDEMKKRMFSTTPFDQDPWVILPFDRHDT
jgi:hypothetical protein